MTKNEYILPQEVNKKPFETVYELKDEIKNKEVVEKEERHAEEVVRLPMLSKITDKDGKVKLPPEFINKLRDPNARFRLDLVVFPLRVDSNGRWEWLRIPCPVEECMSRNDRTVYNWIHSGCGSNMQWSTKARLQCSSCESPSHISRWRFSCHRHTGYKPYSTTYFAIAVRLALKARNSTIDSNFSNELLDYLAEHGDEF